MSLGCHQFLQICGLLHRKSFFVYHRLKFYYWRSIVSLCRAMHPFTALVLVCTLNPDSSCCSGSRVPKLKSFALCSASEIPSVCEAYCSALHDFRVPEAENSEKFSRSGEADKFQLRRIRHTCDILVSLMESPGHRGQIWLPAITISCATGLANPISYQTGKRQHQQGIEFTLLVETRYAPIFQNIESKDHIQHRLGGVSPISPCLCGACGSRQIAPSVLAESSEVR